MCMGYYVSPGLIVAVLSDVGIKCPVSTVTVLSVTVLNVVLPFKTSDRMERVSSEP